MTVKRLTDWAGGTWHRLTGTTKPGLSSGGSTIPGNGATSGDTGRSDHYALDCCGLPVDVDVERYRRDPTYYREINRLVDRHSWGCNPEQQGVSIVWKTSKMKMSKVNTMLGNAAHDAVQQQKTETQAAPFHLPYYGSAWLAVDQIKIRKGIRHGRYVITEPGPLRRKWFASRVGPDVISIATSHEGIWFEYARHASTGTVTQMKPEMAGMGNTSDVKRMDNGKLLLDWLAPLITKIDDVLDSMDLDAAQLDGFQLGGFLEEENQG